MKNKKSIQLKKAKTKLQAKCTTALYVVKVCFESLKMPLGFLRKMQCIIRILPEQLKSWPNSIRGEIHRAKIQLFYGI